MKQLPRETRKIRTLCFVFQQVPYSALRVATTTSWQCLESSDRKQVLEKLKHHPSKRRKLTCKIYFNSHLMKMKQKELFEGVYWSSHLLEYSFKECIKSIQLTIIYLPNKPPKERQNLRFPSMQKVLPPPQKEKKRKPWSHLDYLQPNYHPLLKRSG